MSLGKDNDEFDLTVDIRAMMAFYGRYDEITLVDDVNIVSSQILFDATLRANKVSIRVAEEQQETLDKILATLFHTVDDSEDIGEIVREQIKRKHTCFNRTARLTRLLKTESASRALQAISEKLS